jgi:hypothetical protein
MFLINHNLNVKIFPWGDVLVPDYVGAHTTNGVPSILANSNGCAAFSGGKATSFVMIDFVDVGKGVEAVDILNGFASQ